MIIKKLASEYRGFKIRSNKIIFSEGEVYGCYNWVDLGDMWLKEYRGFTKQEGVFSARARTDSLEDILDHVCKCPITVYKILTKDRTKATKWCSSIDEALMVKRLLRETDTQIQKSIRNKPKYELHREDDEFWIITYTPDKE